MTDPQPLHRRPWLLFTFIGLCGVLVIALVMIFRSRLDEWFFTVGEHLGSALIVAGVMGLTYEWFIHEQDRREVVGRIDEMGEAIDDAYKDLVGKVEDIRTSVQATQAHDVFALIRDMAVQHTAIPTIYQPPREKDEIVFATSHEFFRRMVANPNERDEVTKILREWIQSDDIRLGFLASDFVGMLQLETLGLELRKDFERGLVRWPSLSSQEKAALMNYAWAASCCEKPTYGALRALLLTTKYEDIQEWILWVPRQMHGLELRDMISDYLGTRGSTTPGLSSKLLQCTVAAIRSLHTEGGVNMGPIATRHRHIFKAAHLDKELEETIAAAHYGP